MSSGDDPIWRIRDPIQRLEDVKDQIVALLASETALDPATRDMWTSDAKEVYYSLVAAWQLLRGASTDGKRAGSCRSLLGYTRSRFEQASSELKGGARASQLDQEFRDAFDACHSVLSTALAPDLGTREPVPPAARVRKVSAAEYELLCAVCGDPAVVLKTGTPPLGDHEAVVYIGITKTVGLPLDDAATLFGYLDADRLADLHAYVQKYATLEDGIDAYCPPCDKMYCRTHYNVTEEWDAGFYDDAHGTCPAGHTRIIDD